MKWVYDMLEEARKRCTSPLISFMHFQMNDQKLKIYFFIAGFFLTFILLSFLANFPYRFELNINVIKSKDPELKTILLWNSFFNDRTFGLRYK